MPCLLLLGATCSLFRVDPILAADNQPPSVRITLPADGEVFAAHANIVIGATASDADGWVQKVEFLATTLLGQQTQNPMEMGPPNPFQMVWENVLPGEYELTARATDNGGATATSAPVRITVTEGPLPPRMVAGYLRRQVYLNIPGMTLADLTSSPKFPNQPDLVDLNTPFETPSNVYDNYGVRLTGFVLPPVTGEYVFYLASDDQGALFLSTDENPANTVPIALEPTWSGPRSWIDSPSRPEPSNISAPIRLEAGRKYYVEALMKEGGGGDNLAVTWQKPGDPVPVNGDPPIPGEYLATYWPHPIPNPPPVVTITAPDPVATEQSPFVDAMPDTARFVVTRTGSLQSGLTVHLEISGTALNGTDYDRIDHEVLIPAGSATADVWLNAIDDALTEGEETVVIRIGPPLAITDPTLPEPIVQYLIGTPAAARAVIRDNDPQPIVTVEATVPETTEPDPLLDCTIADCLPSPAVFTVHRTGPTSEALEVYYDVQGTASNGVDYRELPRRVTLPVGQSSAVVAVEPIDDASVEGTETVILQLLPVPVLTPEPRPWVGGYLVGNPHSAKVVILDNDPQPTLHVEIVQPHTGQGFLQGAPIEIIAATPVVPPMVDRVEFYAGDVKIGDGVDHRVPALGVRMFTFTWTDVPLGQHALRAKALSADGQTGVSAPVWIAVSDPQAVQVVTLEATDAVASEPGVLTVIDPAQFTVRRTGGADRPLTVFYRIDGTAQNGLDYESLTGAVTLGEDENFATLSVHALRDDWVEGKESVVLTIVPPIVPLGGPEDPVSRGRWFYLIGTPRSAQAVIRDANTPVNVPPSVRIAEPRDGSVFQNPPAIRLMASARDQDGHVISVEFFADDVKLGDGIEAIDFGPDTQGFGLTWTALPPGEHVLTARATDDNGAAAVSAPVHITVQPPAGDRELHVVGVYSGRSNGGPSRNNERGDAAVVVNRPGKYVTLCLSSYEPVLWHLTIPEGTIIERLILGGYYEQTVEGLPPGVEVTKACPAGGLSPWLWTGYSMESGQFYRTLCRLHALTGLELASFHGSYTAPYPTPFVIDTVQNDPRLRSDYPQPTPSDQLPDLRFNIDFYDGSRVFSQAYSLGGPADGSELLPGNLRVTANADRTKFYGLDGEGILEADAAGGAGVIRAPSDVLREGWLMGATFDTLRQRALLVTLSGEGALYGYAPASGLWSTLVSMNNIDLSSLTYHPALDALFGLEVTRSDYGRAVIDRFSPDGHKVGELELPSIPFDIGVVGHRAELVPVGTYLVMLLAPDFPWIGSDAVRDERMYLIDPESRQAWLTYRNACLCSGSVTLEATDPVASEPGDATVVDTAEFTVRRTGDLTQPLTVGYAIQGSARNGVDYSPLNGEVTIEAGRSSATIVVKPLLDQLVEGVEDVVLDLMPPSTGPSEHDLCVRYSVDTPATARATILDSNWMPHQPPRAEIVRPHDGEVFQAPVDITIAVSATDPDGWVPLVEFFADGRKIGEQSIVFITAPPPGEMQSFFLVWSNAPCGSYILTVRATDDRGTTTMSKPIPIMVAGQNTPPWVSVFAPDPFAKEKPEEDRTNTATFKIRRTGGTNEALRVW